MFDDTVAQLEPATPSADRHPVILIVDDDESQVAALEHRLRLLGYRVLTAFSAREARQRILAVRPDLMLLDLRLPDEDGFELCLHLADHPQTCGVPIIVVSALEQPGIVRQARAVGSSFYVRKPYDPNVLLTLIEDSLRRADQLDC